MMMDEPEPTQFQAISKTIIKTVLLASSEGFKKLQHHSIQYGLNFVLFSRDSVSINGKGTRRDRSNKNYFAPERKKTVEKLMLFSVALFRFVTI